MTRIYLRGSRADAGWSELGVRRCHNKAAIDTPPRRGSGAGLCWFQLARCLSKQRFSGLGPPAAVVNRAPLWLVSTASARPRLGPRPVNARVNPPTFTGGAEHLPAPPRVTVEARVIVPGPEISCGRAEVTLAPRVHICSNKPAPSRRSTNTRVRLELDVSPLVVVTDSSLTHGYK